MEKKKDIVVALLQTDIEWASIEANIQQAEQMILSVPEADLYVLPEMFTTGFATKPDGIAEEYGEAGEASTALMWMQKMAQRLSAAITGSVAIKAADGTYRNRLFFVTPEETCYYDKRHLFTYGGEHLTYHSGEERTVVEWRGVRFLLQVCYDLRFPVFSRNGIKDGVADYDCAIYVANWPESRRRVWDVLLHARAIENQCYVIGVNRVGDDVACHYNGGTMLIDAYGKEAVQAEDDKQQCVTAVIDMERLSSFRRKFPVLADGDAFTF